MKHETINGKTYKVTNSGTYYDCNTSNAIIYTLENIRESHTRIRLAYGDVLTGQDWNEEHDVIGYIGRSMGPIKVPILLYNNRSMGGGAILDNCIVKITATRGGQILYKALNYQV